MVSNLFNVFKIGILTSVTCLVFSCTPTPEIPISNTLEIALGDRYSVYVDLLNKAVSKDTAALHRFLEIDNIYDAAGYDHGWVLIQLMKKNGDKDFAKALLKLNKSQLNNLKQYFEVGTDGGGMSNDTLFKMYPNSFNQLSFSPASPSI